MRHLKFGKQVVTANKDLLAEHGEEVMGMADKMHADLQFEAAVAGAIPIIRPLKQSMVATISQRLLVLLTEQLIISLQR